MGPLPADEELELCLAAGHSLLALLTPEERRAEERVLRPLAARRCEGRLFAWSITGGYVSLPPLEGLAPAPLPPGSGAPDPLSAVELAAGLEEPTLVVLRDFHHFLDSAPVLRRLREVSPDLGRRGVHIVFLGPRFRVPEDLEKEVHLVELPPPDRVELSEVLAGVERESGPDGSRFSAEGRERLLDAALGLTRLEAERAFARARARHGALTDAAVDLVVGEKRQILRRGGLLEFFETDRGMDTVGGLAQLKGWLRRRRAAFSEDARDYGLPVPRGVLVLGVQGCGKSLLAKAVSREWQMPLLRFDVGRIFGKYVGESEAAIRRVIHTAESVAPCILWVDEVEKGFAGSGADSLDAGVAARVLGTFLTWLQEKRQPVFVFATANQIRSLPAEFLRKGRFDELFFVDLPTARDREEIFAVHLRLVRRDPARFDLPALAARTDGFTGAEIEQTVYEALYTAYADGRREVRDDDLIQAAGEVVPISATLKESLAAMRQWAERRARPAA